MVGHGLVSFFGREGVSRTLETSSTEWDDDDEWTPLRNTDYVHLGITICYQVIVLLVVLHLWVCRAWPPYIPRQISLVCLTGLAGIVAYCGALIAYGVVERQEGDFLARCSVEGLLDYYGWGVWTSVALVRVYRSWKILVRHTVDMWPAWGQVALISVPWLLPVVAYSIAPDLAGFNERGNWCDINVPIDTTLYVYGCVPIIGAFGLSFQMRKVRKQMNFFRMQILQLLFLLVTGTVLFPLLEVWLETRDDIRRTWIMYDNVVSSLILFWPPIAMPLYRYIMGDEDYLHSYTKGFSTLPTPAQMRSSLKDQLSLEELREEFERFADSKIARELPDFYKACLDREEIEDFFERQAVTTAIIDRFVRIGAEQEVNLNGQIRDKILDTEITSYNIFNAAMEEVLKMMDNNFSAEFHETEAYKKLERVVEQEAEELERLRQMRVLPPKDHVEQESKGLLKLIRRVGESVAAKSSGTRSSRDGTESRFSERTHSSSGVQKGGTLDEDLCSSLDDDFDCHGKLRTVGEKRGAAHGEGMDSVEEESKGDVPVNYPHLPDDGGGSHARAYPSRQTPAPNETSAPPSHRRHDLTSQVSAASEPELGGLPPLHPQEEKSAAGEPSSLPPPTATTNASSTSFSAYTSTSGSTERGGAGGDGGGAAAAAAAAAASLAERAGVPTSDIEAPAAAEGAEREGTGATAGKPASRTPTRSYGRGGSGGASGGSGEGAGGGRGTLAAFSSSLTHRSSEESRSVSWCSDNYGNNSDNYGNSSPSRSPSGGGEDNVEDSSPARQRRGNPPGPGR